MIVFKTIKGKIMEYTYSRQLYKMPSDALIAFESGEILYASDPPTFTSEVRYVRCDQLLSVTKYDRLFTREERIIEYEKEFVLDTPWIVNNCCCSDKSTCCCSDRFAYAAIFIKNPISRGRFVTLNGGKLRDATGVNVFMNARHLTAEEEISYLSHDY